MTNIIDMNEKRIERMSVTFRVEGGVEGDIEKMLSGRGGVTVIIPLELAGPGFERRLYHAMTMLLNVWDVRVSGINVPNVDGEQILMCTVDITDARIPEHNPLDQIVSESDG